MLLVGRTPARGVLDVVVGAIFVPADVLCQHMLTRRIPVVTRRRPAGSPTGPTLQCAASSGHPARATTPAAARAVGRVVRGALGQSETGTATRSSAERWAASASTSAARPSAKVGLSEASPRARRMKARSSATYAAA